MSQYLDELRAKAEAEFAANKAAQNQPVVEEPATPTEPVVPAVEPTPEPVAPIEPAPEPVTPVEQPAPAPAPEPTKTTRRVVYKKVVDLGDGSQPQVFKAATKDELIDKILDAQKNASKYINELKKKNRELQQQVQPDPAQPRSYQPKTLSEAEELEIANDLQVNPTGAIAKAIEAALGAPLEKVRKTLAEVEMRDQIHAVGQQFITAHPEYPINDVNERRMAEYLQKNNLGWTLKNLELAFADLQEAGLVTGLPTSQSADDDDIEEEEVVTPVTPAAQPAPPAPVAPAPVVPAPAPAASTEVPRRRKAVVGVSSSQSAAAVETDSPREASVEDLLRMSPAERRRIVLQQLGRQA